MIAPRRPLASRLVKVRWRPLPAARGLRRRSPRTGGGWLPVGLRWRRPDKAVSGAPTPLHPRSAVQRRIERQPVWRVRTVVLPAAPAARRLEAPRAVTGMRGPAGAALRGESGRRGAMVYRAGLAPPARPASYLPAARPGLREIYLPPGPTLAGMDAKPATPARLAWLRRGAFPSSPAPRLEWLRRGASPSFPAQRLEWLRRGEPPSAPALAPQRVSAPAAAPLQRRLSISSLLRWNSRAEALKQASTFPAGSPLRARTPAATPDRAQNRASALSIHTNARIDWRARTSGPTAATEAGGPILHSLARRTELVWRNTAAPAESGASAISGSAPRRGASGAKTEPLTSAMPMAAGRFAAAAPAVPAVLDAAATERLVEDVLRRAEQRMRIERERRGL